MTWLLGVAGVALLTIGAVDILKTTLGQGGGPIFHRLTSLGWRLGSKLHRLRRGHRVLAIFGVTSFLSAVVLWLGIIWLGWAFVLAADPSAVIVSETGAPATFVDRLHYTGFIFVTLTRGDFEPEGAWAKFISLVATASGFFLISLSMTYVITAVQAASHRRSVALYIYSLGSSARGIVLRGSTCERADCQALSPHLQTLTRMMTELVQNHATFPAVRFFHALDRSSALAPSLAALDDAVTIIEEGLTRQGGLDTSTTRTLRRSIDAYLLTLRDVHIRPAAQVPPEPDLEPLELRGIKTVPRKQFRAALGTIVERRRLLLAMVEADGWSWDDVLAEPDEREQERRPDRADDEVE